MWGDGVVVSCNSRSMSRFLRMEGERLGDVDLYVVGIPVDGGVVAARAAGDGRGGSGVEISLSTVGI